MIKMQIAVNVFRSGSKQKYRRFYITAVKLFQLVQIFINHDNIGNGVFVLGIDKIKIFGMMRDLIFNIGNKIFVFRNKQYVRHFVQSLKVQPDTGYKGITLIIVFNIAVFSLKVNMGRGKIYIHMLIKLILIGKNNHFVTIVRAGGFGFKI